MTLQSITVATDLQTRVFSPAPLRNQIVDNTGIVSSVWQRWIAQISELNAYQKDVPVFKTGVGHTVDDVISLLQTLGICKQS
jgi:hypothetical protein